MKKISVQHGNNFILDIPVIGFGAMGISEFYGKTDEEESYNAITTAIKNGINHFDTADGYAFGENEIFLKNALDLSNKETRNQLIIASKAGILRDKNDPSVRGVCIEPSYLKGQLLKSLTNLGTDYLDIFYIHRLLPNASDQELSALAKFLLEMKNQGLIRSIGLSEPKLEQLQKIHNECSISFVQSEYSILERVVEKNGVLDFCKRENINFVAYSPLCRGMLTDGFNPSRLEKNDFRLTLPKFTGENYDSNAVIVNKLKEIANKKNVSLSGLAIAWLISQGVIAIPGMRKASRVLDAITTLKVNLTQEELEEINQIAYIGAVSGTRYSQSAMDAYGFE